MTILLISYNFFFRLKTKKNRENLEEFLLSCERVTSLTKYYKCEEMFSNLEVRILLLAIYLFIP